MEREIKFRAQSAYSKEWVYGYFCKDYANYYIVSLDGTDTWNIDPESVGQFTGLTDKNGKEIYEGDIYLCNGKKAEIVFYNGCFCVKAGANFSPLNFDCEEDYSDIIVDDFVSTIEIIGNVHENPELL